MEWEKRVPRKVQQAEAHNYALERAVRIPFGERVRRERAIHHRGLGDEEPHLKEAAHAHAEKGPPTRQGWCHLASRLFGTGHHKQHGTED